LLLGSQQFLEDECIDIDELEILWCGAAMYGRVEVIKWALQGGYFDIQLVVS